MDRSSFIRKVAEHRRQGKSIRAIAEMLGVPKGRVERAARSDRGRAEMLLGSSGTLIGRDQELEVIETAVRDASAGQGRIILMAGEPGIGKTRLSHEAVYSAVAAGSRAVEGRCYNREGAPPYWPWIQIVRTLVQQIGSERLWNERGPAMSVISEIDTSLNGDGREGPGRPPADPQGRFRLLDAMAELIRYASSQQSLVMLVDDLHWADRSSLLMLEFVARGISNAPVLIVGAYQDVAVRPGSPIEEFLGSLGREDSVKNLQLTGLDQDHVARLVEAISGKTPDSGTVKQIASRTGGNPFFISEIARLPAEGTASLPVAVRDAVLAHASVLSAQARAVLDAASTIGNEFQAGLLEDVVAGIPTEDVAAALEECDRTRIIEELDQEPGSYRFTHGLMRGTLLENLDPERRCDIHKRVGEALESLHAADPGSNAAQIAHHFDQASDTVSVEKTVTYYRLAGERALEAHAAGEALDYFERALVVSGIDPGDERAQPKDQATADLLFGLARAQALSLPMEQMRRPLRLASTLIDYHLTNGDGLRAAAVADFPIFVVDPASFRDHTQRLLAVIETLPDDSPEAARLWVKYATTVGYADDFDTSKKAFDNALRIARDLNSPDLEIMALSSYVHVCSYAWIADMDATTRALDLAVRRGDLITQSAMCFFGGIFTTHTGEFAEARKLLDKGLEVAPRAGDKTWLALLWGCEELYHLCLGDWDAAREVCVARTGTENWNVLAALHQAILESEVGNHDMVAPLIQQVIDHVATLPSAAFENSQLAGTLGVVDYITDRHLWTSEIDVRADMVFQQSSPNCMFAHFARCGQALSAATRGDVERSTELYAALIDPLKAYPHRWMITPLFISADRVLGLLARAKGDLAAAAAHFDEGRAEAVKRGQQPEAAWCAYELASLLATGDGSDGVSVPDLIADGSAIARRFGMQSLENRFELLSNATQPATPSSRQLPAGLTKREVDVLRLVSAGKTDRQIAETLFISPKTVGKHVSSILRKTDTANRTQAAAFAARHNLS